LLASYLRHCTQTKKDHPYQFPIAPADFQQPSVVFNPRSPALPTDLQPSLYPRNPFPFSIVSLLDRPYAPQRLPFPSPFGAPFSTSLFLNPSMTQTGYNGLPPQ